jgi:hypothetical protein
MNNHDLMDDMMECGNTPKPVATRLEFWPASDGVHLVTISEDGCVRQVGILWT